MTDDDDKPTPRISVSFRAFRDEARALAARCDACADAKLIPSKLYAFDRTGAIEARRTARALRMLADRFEAWPTADPATVAQERVPMTTELLRLQRVAEELCASVPSAPPPRA